MSTVFTARVTCLAHLSALVLAMGGCVPIAGLGKSGPDEASANGQNASAASEEPQEPERTPQGITALSLAAKSGNTTFCPGGEPVALTVAATFQDGEKFDTASNDKTLDRDWVTLQASAGTIDDEHRYWPSLDSPEALQQPVTITARVAEKEAVIAELALSPTFDCEPTAVFTGQHGRSGQTGQQGSYGSNGNSGSQPHAQPGGTGGPGGPGEPGRDAAPVEVSLAYVMVAGRGKLVLARVSGEEGKKAYFLFAPGTRLRVDASGGAGGAGGYGGQGGGGGFGYSANTSGECCNGNGGNGGAGGPGGNGGNGGRGGAVTVKYDKRYAELKDLVEINRKGGAAGIAGTGGGQGHPGPGGSGSQGASGQGGGFGEQGPSGAPGYAGQDGPAPKFSAADASKLFSEEIAKGLSLAK